VDLKFWRQGAETEILIRLVFSFLFFFDNDYTQ